jgi:hypothetical protein
MDEVCSNREHTRAPLDPCPSLLMGAWQAQTNGPRHLMEAGSNLPLIGSSWLFACQRAVRCVRAMMITHNTRHAPSPQVAVAVSPAAYTSLAAVVWV